MNKILKGRYTVLLLFLQTIVSFVGAQSHPEPAYRAAYRRAEKFYSAENATHYTDSAALAGYQQAIILLKRASLTDDSLLFDSYVKSGILQLSFGQPGRAFPEFMSAVALAKMSIPLQDSLLFKPYLYIGSCYYDRYDLDSSLYYYKLAEGILDNHPLLAESERMYNKVGVLYYESGDYRRSIHYFSKALAIVRSNLHPDTVLLVNYQNNMASALLKMDEYEKAIGIYKSLLAYHSYRDELLYNIGTTYLNAGNATEAIRWFQKTRSGGQAKYNTLARAWLRLDRIDLATQCLRQAMVEYHKVRVQQKSQDLANTLKYSGDLLMAHDSATEALVFYQKAIIQLDRDFDDPFPEHNPGSFFGLHNSFLLFDALVAKARAFRNLGEAGERVHTLVNSFAAYAAALSLARHVETMYYSDEARLFLVKRADTIYKEAVDLGYRLYLMQKDPVWLEKIFEFQEAGKASVLQARLGGPGPRSLKGAARELFLDVRKRQAEAAKLSLRLSATNDDAASAQLQTRIRDIELQVSALQEKLDQYPEYHRQKFAAGSVGIATIQKNILTNDYALLSYYYTSRALYCFYVTSEKFGCVTTAWNAATASTIVTLRNYLDAPAIADRRAAAETIRLASLQLIAPIYDYIKDKSRLLIIPYNEIAYLPFEVLESPSGHRPLVWDFSVSYDYSANFLDRPDRRGAAKNPDYKVLGIAPFTGAEGYLPPLKSSASEIDGLPGKLLVGNQATREQFLRSLPFFPIVHLATHSFVNDQDPLQSSIEFYCTGKQQPDSLHRLFEQEIYHLDMDRVALVILSACETANGRMVHSEGLISLSRSFSYAGCKSVIASLWKADDAATAYIIRRVHHYLREGEPKDRALQLAKIDYLDDSHIESRYKTPSYWAHLVLLGDTKPVAESRQGLWLFIVGGFSLVLIIVFGRMIIKYRARKAAPGLTTGVR